MKLLTKINIKGLYKALLILASLLILFGCKKEDKIEHFLELNDDKRYYRKYDPGLQVEMNQSILIDIDNNKIMDIEFVFDEEGQWAEAVNDSIKISFGKKLSRVIFPISYNDDIDYSLPYYHIKIMIDADIEFIGVQKTNVNQWGNSCLGWIRLTISDQFIIINEQFYIKRPGHTGKAGNIDVF